MKRIGMIRTLAFAAVLGVLAAGCGAGSVTPSGGQADSTALEEKRAVNERAWNELSSTLTDLYSADQQTKTGLTIAHDLGLGEGVASGSVPWSDYERVARSLNRWQRQHIGVGRTYWHQLAETGIEISNAMVRYASSGDKARLVEADQARDRLHSVLKLHCEAGYVDGVWSCP